jgi:hypothetical protein
MKQMVAYRLAEGTTPIFISDGGYFLNNDLLVGASVDGLPLPEYVTIFNDKQELLNYVDTFYTEESSCKYLNTLERTAEKEVDAIWAKL